jgi:hypothetical protein
MAATAATDLRLFDGKSLFLWSVGLAPAIQFALKRLSTIYAAFGAKRKILVEVTNFTLVWLFAVVFLLLVNGRAAGTNAPQEWAGCYELIVAPADAAKQLWGKLPRYFELLTKPAYESDLPVRTFGSSPSRNWLINVWQTKGENSARKRFRRLRLNLIQIR